MASFEIKRARHILYTIYKWYYLYNLNYEDGVINTGIKEDEITEMWITRTPPKRTDSGRKAVSSLP